MKKKRSKEGREREREEKETAACKAKMGAIKNPNDERHRNFHMSITPNPITAGLMRIQDTERVKRLGRSTKKEGEGS